MSDTLDRFETIPSIPPTFGAGVSIDQWEMVLKSLPEDVKDVLKNVDLDALSEIRMVLGYPLVLNISGKLKRFESVTINKAEHIDVVRQVIGAFADDGRSGIENALHRYASVPNRYNTCLGIVIRLARAHMGSAAPLRQNFDTFKLEPISFDKGRDTDLGSLNDILMDHSSSMMLVGRPGSRKTTLLRDITRVSSLPEPDGAGLDQLCVLVDSSNEVGGFGDKPHPAIGHALRIQVGDPKTQASKIRIAIRNLTCVRLIVDEIGYNDDVEQIQSCSNLGVGVFATLHGHNLLDVIDNSVYWPLLGMKNRDTKSGRAAFRHALELHAPEMWVLYPNLNTSVADILEGKPPMGIRIGSGWSK